MVSCPHPCFESTSPSMHLLGHTGSPPLPPEQDTCLLPRPPQQTLLLSPAYLPFLKATRLSVLRPLPSAHLRCAAENLAALVQEETPAPPPAGLCLVLLEWGPAVSHPVQE